MKDVKDPNKLPMDTWVRIYKDSEHDQRVVSIKNTSVKITKKDGHFIGVVGMWVTKEAIGADKTMPKEEFLFEDVWAYENGDWYRWDGD